MVLCSPLLETSAPGGAPSLRLRVYFFHHVALTCCLFSYLMREERMHHT